MEDRSKEGKILLEKLRTFIKDPIHKSIQIPSEDINKFNADLYNIISSNNKAIREKKFTDAQLDELTKQYHDLEARLKKLKNQQPNDQSFKVLQDELTAENWGPLRSSEKMTVDLPELPKESKKSTEEQVLEQSEELSQLLGQKSEGQRKTKRPTDNSSKSSEPTKADQPTIPPSTLQIWLATLGLTPALLQSPGALWKYLQPYVEQYRQLPSYQQDIINNIIIKGGITAAIFGSIYGVGKVSRQAFRNWYETRKQYIMERYPRRIPIINQLENRYKHTPLGREKYRIFKKLLHVITDKPIVRHTPQKKSLIRKRVRPEETVIEVVDKQPRKKSRSPRIIKRRKGKITAK